MQWEKETQQQKKQGYIFYYTTVATTKFYCTNTTLCLFSDSANKNDVPEKSDTTYGSLDLGIRVPSSFIRSLMLNLRLLSTVEKQERPGRDYFICMDMRWNKRQKSKTLQLRCWDFEFNAIQGAWAQNGWNKSRLTEVMVVFLLPFFH